MYTLPHKKKKNQFISVGGFKGEVKKVRALFNRTIRRPDYTSQQVNQHKFPVHRDICCPIPLDQERQAMIARGEKMDTYFSNPILYVKVIGR